MSFRKSSANKKRWLTYSAILIAILSFLIAGPFVINYIFLAETQGLNIDLAFSAGDMLVYYGAVLGGLVTCFAIVTTIHINNENRKYERERLEFERIYAVYHKLPEILAKLEIAAIHVQYTLFLDEDKLLETLDFMKESESILRDQHFANDTYYNKRIELLLKEIITASVQCQESVENFLQDKEGAAPDLHLSHKAMEATFIALRESIATVKGEIMAEINKFVFTGNN